MSVDLAQLRIGNGFDIHRFADDARPLRLGGITIPHHKGLLGHSDADVIIHALADSILSCISCPDIGVLFPNNNAQLEGINSLELLKEVNDLRLSHSFSIISISITLHAEAPKISPLRDQMLSALSQALGVNASIINITATTHEGLGAIGQSQGIAASAITLGYYN